MSVVVIDPPQPLVELPLVKQHLRLDTDDDDALLPIYIAAACATIDGPGGWLGRAIGKQTLELRLDGFSQPIWGWAGDSEGLFWTASPGFTGWTGSGFPAGRQRLPYPPLIDIVSVTYEDGAGVVITLPSSSYLATDEGLGATFGNTLPAGRWEPGAVKIRYEAGYPDAVPPAIVAAVLLMIGDLYANRQTVETGVRAAAVAVPMSTTVQALLAPFRVYN